jgi:hypothetical protein
MKPSYQWAVWILFLRKIPLRIRGWWRRPILALPGNRLPSLRSPLADAPDCLVTWLGCWRRRMLHGLLPWLLNITLKCFLFFLTWKRVPSLLYWKHNEKNLALLQCQMQNHSQQSVTLPLMSFQVWRKGPQFSTSLQPKWCQTVRKQ